VFCAFWLAAVCGFGLVQSDDQSIRPNLDPLHIDLDKAKVAGSSGFRIFFIGRLRVFDHCSPKYLQPQDATLSSHPDASDVDQ